MKKLLIGSAAVLGMLVLAGYIGVKYVAPYAIIKPYRFDADAHKDQFQRGITPQDYGLTSDIFNITVSDSIGLKGWFIHTKKKPAKATVLVLHGIGSCKEHMLGFAELLANNGFNAILYDSRAHGESGGIYCTYGFYEHEDVSALVTNAAMRFGEIEPFFIYGNSFGGAVALLAMASDKRLKCGVIESTFANFEEIACDYAKRLAYIFPCFVVRKVLKHSEKIANFDIERIKPEKAAAKVMQPTLIIHGKVDKHVSIDYGRRIFAKLASPHKEWFPVKNGNHYNLWKVGGEQYRAKYISFFDKWIKS
jgi:dipeptidyl aminopeptidase/acylaminoacyl peptidase